MRACSLLPVATGNLGKPGAGFLYLNWFNARGIDEAYLTAAHLSQDVPAISHMDLADCLADPERSQALICWNMNVAASGPRQQQLRHALRRDDLFTVVLDLFQTDTADFADIVLPAASFLEFDDLFTPYFQLMLSAQVKAAEPLGESLPNQEIFRRLARAMGYTEPELYEADADIIATVLRTSGLVENFAALAAVGSVPVSDEPIIQFADLTFPTPSGRIEIASAQAEADGHPRVPLPLADPETGRWPAAPAVAGVDLHDERQLRQRGQAGEAGRTTDGGAASGRRRGAGTPGGRRGPAVQRDRQPETAGAALGRRPARRGPVTQRSLAQAGSRRGERERAQPRPQDRHRREHVRP